MKKLYLLIRVRWLEYWREKMAENSHKANANIKKSDTCSFLNQYNILMPN